ncbi:MAG: DUF6375 family protein [Phycisphaerae bacterium]|nr:DUF6375 family protein [Phycisphaerae bacterium]
MKLWRQYASEHSMDLHMIGKFNEIHDAHAAKRAIDELTQQVGAESERYSAGLPPHKQTFSEAMHALLAKYNLFSIHPTELGQFELDVTTSAVGKELRLHTDEIDVSAFLKLLLEFGAQVYVTSGERALPDAKHQ